MTMQGLESSTQHNLLGLSPYYWTYIPLLNRDILSSVQLINGVDCYVTCSSSSTLSTLSRPSPREHLSTEASEAMKSSSTSFQPQLSPTRKRKRLDNETTTISNKKTMTIEPTTIPVSKCELMGRIVNIERRSNGAIFYLLDDGTGLVDCLAWEDDHDNAVSSSISTSYSLDSICIPRQNNSYSNPRYSKKIGLGDLVRIRGKIRCIHPISNDDNKSSSSSYCTPKNKTFHKKHDNADARSSDDDGDVGCDNAIATSYTREIHISSIEKINQHHDLDSEAVHWLRCIEFQKKIHGSYKEGNSIPDKLLIQNRICSGIEILDILGPKFKSYIREKDKLQNNHADEPNAPILPQSSCPCGEGLVYKSSLLYCHCTATKEALDPDFVFRDALLYHLLQLEEKQTCDNGFDKNDKGKNTTKTSNDAEDEDVKEATTEYKSNIRPLYFYYKNIVENSDLLKVAMDVVSTAMCSSSCSSHCALNPAIYTSIHMNPNHNHHTMLKLIQRHSHQVKTTRNQEYPPWIFHRQQKKIQGL